MARRSNGSTIENLREMGAHVERAAKQALRNGAYVVAADAKSKVPVRTGRLRDSIKVTPSRSGGSYKISFDAKNNGVAYGKVVELKTPFLYPALDENRQQIRENIKNAARDAIRRGH